MTIHFYALSIIAGVAIAIWLGDKRLRRDFPAAQQVVADVAIIAVPAGLIGGRLYHVLTSPEKYFGAGGSPIDALKIWQGGLGIWGAISLGALGAYLAYRRLQKKSELPSFAHLLDALAPGLLIAQAIGRWGNWFNGELFGRPLNAPWSLEIPVSLRPPEFSSYQTFHPTFLYESVWTVLLALLLLAIGKRLPTGSLFALYVAGYSFARFFIEGLRIDDAYIFGGLRLNQYVSAIIFVGASAALIKILRHKR